MDHYCTDQEVESALAVPGSSSYGTDENAKDPDCASIYFDPGNVGSAPLNGPIYQQDFRIGISMAEKKSDCTGEQTVVQWTSWASLGGGEARAMGFVYLLTLTAIISINLAIINMLPFPALDGGRLLFVLIESITRRPINAKFVRWTNTIGFAFLLILMLAVTVHDIVKLF
jgi:regulator of sigma E protease